MIGPHSTWTIEPSNWCKLLLYIPETGKLFWKPRSKQFFKNECEIQMRRWNGMYANTEAFTTVNSAGYLKGAIAGKHLVAHRVAWVVFWGNLPKGPLDHINGIKTDNRIFNLREVTASENAKNASMRHDNKSGTTGISKQGNSWVAQIGGVKNRVYLGSFSSLDAAKAARRRAEQSLGYHPNHGRS